MSDKDEAYMHEINRLEGERDFWRQKANELLEQLRQQTKSFCSHCGELFPKGKEGVEQFRQHIAECNAHPLHPLAKQCREASNERDELRAAVLSMRHLWPLERWATLSAICRDHPCIDEIGNLTQGNEA